MAGAAFYEPGRLAMRKGLAVSVDRPCLLVLRETPKGYAVSLANPRNAGLTVRVRIEVGPRVFQKAVVLPRGAGREQRHGGTAVRQVEVADG